jgi:hypothetical protein
MQSSAQLSTNLSTVQFRKTSHRGTETQREDWERVREGEFLQRLLCLSLCLCAPMAGLFSITLLSAITYANHNSLLRFPVDNSISSGIYFAPLKSKGPCNCIGSELPSLPFASIWVFTVRVYSYDGSPRCVSRARWEFAAKLLVDLKMLQTGVAD